MEPCLEGHDFAGIFGELGAFFFPEKFFYCFKACLHGEYGLIVTARLDFACAFGANPHEEELRAQLCDGPAVLRRFGMGVDPYGVRWMITSHSSSHWPSDRR